MSDTRLDFFKKLTDLAREDENIILLVGDLGYSFMEDFAKKFPNQFINCGIAEQNMVGVAAGLARMGKKPYVYSGAMFLCTRALEQIRDDVCYQNLDIKLVGTGASGFLGFTHNFGENENYRDYLKGMPNLRFSDDYRDLFLDVSGPYFIKL